MPMVIILPSIEYDIVRFGAAQLIYRLIKRETPSAKTKTNKKYLNLFDCSPELVPQLLVRW